MRRVVFRSGGWCMPGLNSSSQHGCAAWACIQAHQPVLCLPGTPAPCSAAPWRTRGTSRPARPACCGHQGRQGMGGGQPLALAERTHSCCCVTLLLHACTTRSLAHASLCSSSSKPQLPSCIPCPLLPRRPCPHRVSSGSAFSSCSMNSARLSSVVTMSGGMVGEASAASRLRTSCSCRRAMKEGGQQGGVQVRVEQRDNQNQPPE